MQNYNIHHNMNLNNRSRKVGVGTNILEVLFLSNQHEYVEEMRMILLMSEAHEACKMLRTAEYVSNLSKVELEREL